MLSQKKRFRARYNFSFSYGRKHWRTNPTVDSACSQKTSSSRIISHRLVPLSAEPELENRSLSLIYLHFRKMASTSQFVDAPFPPLCPNPMSAKFVAPDLPGKHGFKFFRLKAKTQDLYLPFFSYHNLKQHIKLHSGVKPYECNICHKRFTRNYTLRLHKQKVTFEH